VANHDDTSGIGRPPGPRQTFRQPAWQSSGSHDDVPASHPRPAVNQPSAAGPADADQVASIVLERIRAQLGPQASRPMDAPPADQAVALRDQAPELYELWLRIARERAATANYVERAPYEVPERLAQAGRPRALGALIIVLAFCGYLAWLGGPGPYIAGLIALVDLGAMVGIFFGLSPERLSGLRRPDRSGRPRDRTRLATRTGLATRGG
jgi:hypothetical protein